MPITLSIIVPIYNVENYIVQCVDSLLSEKPENVEIVLVNDGSKDQSVDLIKAQFNSELLMGRLILLEQENQGVSVARNTGIAHAHGEYIGFVDADDLILPGYYSSVLSVISMNSPDIVEIGWKTFSEVADIESAVENYVHPNFGMHPAVDLLEDVFAASIWYPVIRFFKKTLLHGHFFPVGVRFCEDLILLHVLYEKAENIFQIKNALYAYRINALGATMNMSAAYVKPLQDLYITLLHRKEHHVQLLKIAVFYVLHRCMQNTNTYSKLDNKIESDLLFMRLKFWRYTSVGARRLRIFMFPLLSNFIFNVKRKLIK
ncbi:glycosyltransferase [Chitinibacter fontanus]|uniref:Glycosyltransferase n=1 Tax=Chitinibacter fontanus TaxID=1737446 RepID=A0A7D5VBM2_9NEIS|nr:glycosyltransferase [Chitinibacter fontanus]QLI82552.1 glycosyltransferase [Chitinibacter fontanus]